MVKKGTLCILVCQESRSGYLSKNLKEPAIQREVGCLSVLKLSSTRSRTDNTVLMSKGINILITGTDFQI